MEVEVIYLLLSIFFLLILGKFYVKRYPPGPRGWPLIGNMGMMNQLTHRGLAKLAEKYGGVFHLRIGFLHMVTISSPETARQVLQIHDNIFSNRPANIAIRYLTYDRADMAFAHYGPFWRQMRKLCVINLFSRKRAESWDSVKNEVDAIIRTVALSSGTAINIGELVFKLTMSITYRAAFGSVSKLGQDEFIKIIQEFSMLFGAFNLTDFFPLPGWLDPHGLHRKLVRARDSLDRFIDQIIDEHLEKKKNSEHDNPTETDMVDELLAFHGHTLKETKVSEADDSVKLTRENIKAIIMDVMFGGTETVASAIEWAMAELLKSPEDLAKVQQELESVVGLERKLEETDLDKLTYLHFCLKEVLRLHPPIPLLLHETAAPATISGYYIPKKCRVMINVWAIGRDPNAWEDPNEFKPYRFLEEGAPDFKGNNFEFIPFGSGRRSCPGMQLGLFALEMTVAHLLHCFTWELPQGMKPSDLDMNDMFGLTAPRAERLVAIPTPRLLCQKI